MLHKAIEAHTCRACNQSLSAQGEEFVKKLIESFQVSSKTSNLLMGIRSELERMVKSALD